MTECYVICTYHGSCIVNAVCLDRKYAEKWIERENKILGVEAFYLEVSQLIK